MLFLNATDRVPVRTAVVVAYMREAIVKVEEVDVAAERPGRPVDAVAASRVGIAVVVATVAGSREKDLRDILFIRTRTAETITWLTIF